MQSLILLGDGLRLNCNIKILPPNFCEFSATTKFLQRSKAETGMEQAAMLLNLLLPFFFFFSFSPGTGLYNWYNYYTEDLCALELKNFLSDQVQRSIGWLLAVFHLFLLRRTGDDLTSPECHIHQPCFVRSMDCTEHSDESTFPQHQVTGKGSSPVTEQSRGCTAHARSGARPSEVWLKVLLRSKTGIGLFSLVTCSL